jgi:2'-5' RNA ligase
MRLFLAIELSADFRQHLARLQDALRPLARVSYTKPDNLHLTLKFLGEVTDQAVKPLCDSLAGIGRCGELELVADHLACFPERGPIRIIGAGLAAPPGLLELVSRIEAACEQHNLPRETRAYRAHITFARARDGLPSALRPRLHDAVSTSFPSPLMVADQYVLMESRLLPTGPVYIPLARFDMEPADGIQPLNRDG